MKHQLSILALAVTAALGTADASVLYFSNAYGYTDIAFVNGQVTGNILSDYEPGKTSASIAGSSGGRIVSASSNLSTGQLRVLNTGNVTPGFGPVNVTAQAILGDTITATGSLGGLNLGVNVTVNGSTAADNQSADIMYLEVAAYTPGTFAAGLFGNQANTLFTRGFSLGSNSQVSPTHYFGGSSTVDGHFGDGTNTLNLNIPFSTLPSSFELAVALKSFELGDSQNWNNDYSHTLNVALSAAPGVTLNSASGTLPGTVSSIPEPGTFALALPLLALAAFFRRKKERGNHAA